MNKAPTFSEIPQFPGVIWNALLKNESKIANNNIKRFNGYPVK